MVTSGYSFRDTAKRLRRTGENSPGRAVVMTIVECAQCGQRFAIGHHPTSQDAGLAAKQATWLQDRFVWDHIQENKHQGSITLPAVAEMK
jgi:hypothetical protein